MKNTKKGKKHRLVIASDMKNLSIVRDFIETIIKKTNMEEQRIEYMKMAVDEVISNVIEHSYQYDTSKKIYIEVSTTPRAFSVEITDKGEEKFNPNSVPKVNLKKFISERRKGGLGVHLINNFVDEVVYYRNENDYNCVKLTNKISL